MISVLPKCLDEWRPLVEERKQGVTYFFLEGTYGFGKYEISPSVEENFFYIRPMSSAGADNG
jgi:hypothetical protein